MTLSESHADWQYARRLGRRLREVRRWQRLSLHGVEATSNGEFRASVLGAYERGERTVSLLRLQRLARLYHVPVAQLLPQDHLEGGRLRREGAARAARGKVTIDLARLAQVDLPEKRVLAPYVHALEQQRQDFKGRVLTLRDDDVSLLAGMVSLSVAQFRQQLQHHGIAR